MAEKDDGIVSDLTVESVTNNGETTPLHGSDERETINRAPVVKEERTDDEICIKEEIVNVSTPFSGGSNPLKTEDESMAVEALWQFGCMVSTPTHMCKNCFVVFNTLADLEDHLMLCEPVSTVEYKCDHCKETFFREIDLKNHKISHEVLKPYACRICGRMYRKNVDLNVHMQNHEIKPYKCGQCGTEFERASSLSNHMKTHSKFLGMGTASFSSPWRKFYSSGEEKITNENNVEGKHMNASLPSVCSAYYKLLIEKSDEQDSENPESHVTDKKEEENIVPSKTTKPSKNTIKSENTVPSENTAPSENTVPSENAEQDYLEKRPYKCHHCNVRFSRMKALKSHAKLHEDNWGALAECERCGEVFPNEEVHEIHERNCNKNKSDQDFVPIISGKLMQPVQILKPNNNRGNEATIKNHFCTMCHRAFTTKQKLFRHTWIHREKKFICEICSIALNCQEYLDEHRRTVHAARTPFTCDSCGKSFVSRQGLWEHMRSHDDGMQKRFKCVSCNKVFSSRQGLVVHTRTHTGERPYGCRFCRKAFLDGGTRRKHERIHTGERPHVCPLCQRAFIQKVVLREHLRWVHIANMFGRDTDEDELGAYGCTLCIRVFMNKEELCAHFVKHSDQLAAMVKTTCEKSKNAVMNQKPVKAKITSKNKKTVINRRISKAKNKSKGKVTKSSNKRGKQKHVKFNVKPVKKVVKRSNKMSSLRQKKLSKSQMNIEQSLKNKNTLEPNNEVGSERCVMCGNCFQTRAELLNHISVHI